MNNVIPAMFIAHGSPMVAIEDSEYGAFLDQLATQVTEPKAILLFSAHWESRVQKVSEIENYSLIYDFGGFPEALYQVKYPARGDLELSKKVQSLLGEAGIAYEVERQRGLDHGAWTILKRIYPKANVPVIAMSVNPDAPAREQYAIGKALASLREEGVLIIGSGVTVHNFQLFHAQQDRRVHQAVREFETWLAEHLETWDIDSLFSYEQKAPHARLAVPVHGNEHFVPLFYAMGSADRSGQVRQLHLSYMFNVMTNSVYQMG